MTLSEDKLWIVRDRWPDGVIKTAEPNLKVSEDGPTAVLTLPYSFFPRVKMIEGKNCLTPVGGTQKISDRHCGISGNLPGISDYSHLVSES